ncbi:MAG: adenosylcobinamide-GDP ribazoletransferase [Thermoproteota archaeon]|nr:adenosylcobinamide-GDP ribazoletransferase [Thermoproteota archaeon]
MGSDGILSVLSFLTIIPVPRSANTDLSVTAHNMHLFPIVGAIIGITVGVFAYVISTYLDNYLVSFLVTIAILLITGMQHADALADFADGMMVKGSKDAKRKAMSDPAVGTAGATSLILFVIGLIIAISTFNSGLKLLICIITAEVIAKYIMVIEAGRSRSAWEGFSSPFTEAMKDKKKIAFATITTLIIIVILNGYIGLISLGMGLVIACIICNFSAKHFGGLTGDVLGASNEITRISSLLILSLLVI